jgi:AcrR family transcriptional regulator
MSTVHYGAPDRSRRPKDRKERILAVAAERFRKLGYHNVSMAEIAAAVGITAGALYRHFRGKQDLLAGCVREAGEEFGALLRERGDLDALVRAVAGFTLDHRELGVLWQREARHLEPAEQDRIRQLLRDGAAEFSRRTRDARPGLSEMDADLLAWGVLTVLASPAHHSVDLPRPEFEALLCGAVHTVAWTEVPASEERAPDPPGIGLSRASRREAVLAAAIRLFDEQGYQSVRMAEVGAAAGISGPSIYHHFANKSELLVATLRRANETLQLGLSHALSHAAGPEAALDAVLDSYLELTLAHRHLIGTLVTEMINLPEEQRHELRRLQHEYVAEWVSLLLAIRPDLPEMHARVLVHATLTVVNDMSRIRHLRQGPGIRTAVRRICHNVLTSAEQSADVFAEYRNTRAADSG